MQKRSGRTILGPKRRSGLDRALAEEIGLAALGFLAEDPGRLGRFLSLSGMEPGQLSAQAGEPHMQAALLDHILSDETLLLVFTTEKRFEPELIAPAQAMLAGDVSLDE
jgi:hypothetical protein